MSNGPFERRMTTAAAALFALGGAPGLARSDGVADGRNLVPLPEAFHQLQALAYRLLLN